MRESGVKGPPARPLVASPPAGLTPRVGGATSSRFTATLVVPTPPMEPATAMTWLPRGRFSPRPNRRSLIRPKAPKRSSIRTGCVKNSLALARIAPSVKLPPS